MSVHELLGPLLRWIDLVRHLGEASWEPDDRRTSPHSSVLDGFERSGAFTEAIDWIASSWEEGRSWELAAEFLRFHDLAGLPDGWRRFVDKLRPSLTGHARDRTGHAIAYYHGRLLGQSGHTASALTKHAANHPRRRGYDVYQLLSWFEEGQLLFRAENFDEAYEIFEDLYYILVGHDTHSRLFVDVLKFLSAYQSIDVIYDTPGSAKVWIKGSHGNHVLAEQFGEAALVHAARAGYTDGYAWALGVKAFAAELGTDAAEAESRYQRALASALVPGCRKTTLFHLRVYHAAFLRRQGRYGAAGVALEALGEELRGRARGSDRVRVAEQVLALANHRGDANEAETLITEIEGIVGADPLFREGNTRRERRLRALR
jgi:hypothetical protein